MNLVLYLALMIMGGSAGIALGIAWELGEASNIPDNAWMFFYTLSWVSFIIYHVAVNEQRKDRSQK